MTYPSQSLATLAVSLGVLADAQRDLADMLEPLTSPRFPEICETTAGLLEKIADTLTQISAQLAWGDSA